jgi:hypothetical protein
MSELDRIIDALDSTPEDRRHEVLASHLAALPFDTQTEVAADVALHYAEIALGLIRAAVATGGPVLGWMRAVMDDRIVAAHTAGLDDEWDELGGDP